MVDRKLHNLKAFHQILVSIHVSGLCKSLNLLTKLINLVAVNSVQSSSPSFFISPSSICQSLNVYRNLSRDSLGRLLMVSIGSLWH